MPSRYEALKESLRKERESEIQRFKNEAGSGDLSSKVRTGLCVYPLVYHDQILGPEGGWRVTFLPTQPMAVPEAFRSGAPVRLFKDADEESSVLISVKEEAYVLSLEEVPEWAEEGKLGLELLPDETTDRELNLALDKVIRAEKGTRAKFFADLFLDETKLHLTSPKFKQEKDISADLNKSQSDCVSAILQTEDVFFVHGPPGTGKTKTLAEAIRILASRGKKILATAPTNAAADVLGEAVLKTGVPVLRLGHPARMTEAILESCLDAKLHNHPDAKWLERDKREVLDLFKKAKKYKRNFGKQEAEERRSLQHAARELRRTVREREKTLVDFLLDTHSVIVCTHTGASSALLNAFHFDYVFLDEASQATEPSSWIPILRAERAIFAGDPKQLPPTVLSEDALLQITLMERFLPAFEKFGRSLMLDTQYRMKDPIQFFSNIRFYQSRLKSGLQESEKNSLPSTKTEFPFGSSFVFIDSSGTDTAEESRDGSLGNPWEAEFTISLLPALLESGLSADKIGIVTPYRFQKFLLEKLLEERIPEAFSKVEVGTVDSFQGREKDFLLFSLVRSNVEGKIGFLAEERRWNVGMTRAKQLLILIGDGSTLGETEFFRELLVSLEKAGELRTAWEFIDS
ncbi:RNA helicase [Leptospira perolatii]|uniref:RNA helicase n=1 Tax=Leptospira perolatii TaxID=2023191 RepID=A0A2M9ZJ39_9LEPT|nr:AAA domain-containing protein [Leptospira perolatii]PJZ68180.1 RNA helicase [Leptospira perolatii]PJZ72075.1 RNA helicase [Leptospira perolatii]